MRARSPYIRWLWLWVLCGTALAASAPAPQPPSVLYGELFDAVQRARIFPDSKTFADAVPQAPPDVIANAFRKARGAADFDLQAFVARYFVPPAALANIYKSEPGQGICDHIKSLWPALTREPDAPVAGSSLLPLPRSYVVPGGRFRETYYWDSYFTMLGLEADGRHDLTLQMLENFAHLISAYGHIPNGNRSYYLSRSQPPFFAAMVGLAAARDGDAVFAKYLPQLLREHDFWMEGAERLAPGGAHRRVVRLAGGTVLNRYWDDRATPRDEAYREDLETAAASTRPAPEVYRNLRAGAESGWDFSSRWLADGHTLASIHTVDFLPVDLNSLLYELEQTIAHGYAAQGDAAAADAWKVKAATRAAAIRALFWNEQRRIFTDYLWRARQPAKQVTAAGLYPLFFGIADDAQAHQVASTLRLTLLRPEGIVPTTVVSGQQWDAPNGWAPLQWVAIRGLDRYGEHDLAEAIKQGWSREVSAEFKQTAKLVEKYNVTGEADAGGGEYPNQDGFGWTNGVFSALECARPATP